MMIPKIVHYCWVSTDPFPSKIRYCIDSWKKNLPDYEIRQWTMERIWQELKEDSCEDGHESPVDLYGQWIQEAYDAQKYAFVSDWVRLYALKKHGGIYLDSDVEVFKRFDDLLDLPYFLGFENENSPETAAMGAQKGCFWIEKCFGYYKRRCFIVSNEKEMQKYIKKGEYISDPKYHVRPSPKIIEEVLARDFKVISIINKEAFINDKKIVCVLPRHYFSFSNEKCKLEKRERYCLHHGMGLWKPKNVQRNLKIWRILNMILGSTKAGIITNIFNGTPIITRRSVFKYAQRKISSDITSSCAFT